MKPHGLVYTTLKGKTGENGRRFQSTCSNIYTGRCDARRGVDVPYMIFCVTGKRCLIIVRCEGRRSGGKGTGAKEYTPQHQAAHSILLQVFPAYRMPQKGCSLGEYSI